MTPILNNEIKFNVLCHTMAKNNLSLACNYITDIFNGSMSHKDRCSKAIKASLLAVRGFLLCIPFVNRITQFALRILSPELTIRSFFYFGEEELEIRYGIKTFLKTFIEPFVSKSLEEVRRELQDLGGLFTELNTEEKKQLLQLFCNTLLPAFQDPHFQSKFQAHFQKILQDLPLQEDELEIQLRSVLQNALQNTLLDVCIKDFLAGMKAQYEEDEDIDAQNFVFANFKNSLEDKIRSTIQDPEFKKDILAMLQDPVLQDPVIQAALQTNLQNLEFQRDFQGMLQNDEHLHLMIQDQFPSVQRDILLPAIQKAFQDPRWPV
ncbi:MAG: hypothetical protein WBD50_06235 [Candidatus Rhabdochlamydia sp.]